MASLKEIFSSGALSKLIRIIVAFEALQDQPEYQEFVEALEALND